MRHYAKTKLLNYKQDERDQCEVSYIDQSSTSSQKKAFQTKYRQTIQIQETCRKTNRQDQNNNNTTTTTKTNGKSPWHVIVKTLSTQKKKSTQRIVGENTHQNKG